MRELYWTALMLWWQGLALPSMSLKYFCIWYLSMRLYLKDHKGDGIKVWGEVYTQSLTCLKVVWGAALAPVSSMYSSQLNSASSSMESASKWTKSPVNHHQLTSHLSSRLKMHFIYGLGNSSWHHTDLTKAQKSQEVIWSMWLCT